MRLTVLVFSTLMTLSAFAMEEPIKVRINDKTLESFRNVVVKGLQKGLSNVKQQTSGESFFLINPFLVETENSTYKVSAFKAEQPVFDNGWGGSDEYLGEAPITGYKNLSDSIVSAIAGMRSGHDTKGNVFFSAAPATITLKHPTVQLILFLSSTTGSVDKIGYNPQADEELAGF